MNKISRALVLCWYGLLLFAVFKLVFAIWFGWTWPQRLEAAATEQIKLPSKAPDVVVLYDRSENSPFIVNLVMSAPVTVVVPFWNDQTRFVSIKAGTGAACEGPLAFKKYAFVQLGLFDHCLIRQETQKPTDALVLRLNRDHGLNSVWAGIFGIRYSWDHNGRFGHDQAWQFDLLEWIDGEETLLGRAVAAEFYSDDGRRGVPHFWPDLPKIEDEKRALRKQSVALSESDPEDETQRWAYRGSGWYDEVHDTPSDLSSALLTRALNVKMDLSWLETAAPDPLRAMDYAEKLILSKTPIVETGGENLLYFLMTRAGCRWPASCKPPSDALSVAIQDRALEIGLKVLDVKGNGKESRMVYHFMVTTLPKEYAAQLLNRAFENALLAGHSTDHLFFQQLLYRFNNATKPLLSDHICSINLQQLRETELKYGNTFDLCSDVGSK